MATYNPDPNKQMLHQLRTRVSAQQHSLVLQNYIQARVMPVGAILALNNLFRSAMLVSIHCNESPVRPFGPFDIGIATFDRRRVAEELDDDRCAGAHGEKYLDHLWAMYFRISEHAHLPARNDKPDAYLFGSTVIASKSEVKDFLTDIWEQPIDENKPELGFRPIILLYFNSQSKHQASSMWEQIRFDPSRMDTTIATLDCQAIAEQCKIAHNPFPALCDLLSQFDIEFYDIENCGNAAFYIIIVAMLSVLKEHLYRAPDNMQASPGQHGRSASKPAQMVMDWLMMSPTSAPPIGDHNPKYH